MPAPQALRDALGKPLISRSPEHNRVVGGKPASKHMACDAVDIAMANHDPAAFEAVARKAGFLAFDFYSRSGFIHVDTGPVREWGERVGPRPVPFAVETPPVRETLADSRSLQSSKTSNASCSDCNCAMRSPTATSEARTTSCNIRFNSAVMGALESQNRSTSA